MFRNHWHYCLPARLLNMRPRLWGSIALLLVLFAPLTLSPADEDGLRALGHSLDLPAHVAHADALVIMGGDTQQRLMPGIELFQQGLAPQIWYTGGSGHGRAAVAQAVAIGVPPEAIYHLLGNNTWEDTQQVARTLRENDLHSVLVVTSWYHLRRTLCVLRHHLAGSDVQIYYQPVGYEDFNPDNWWLNEAGQKAVFSELTKFGFYWFQYGLALGEC
ncbi:MAG: YdcF family protein [Caldilineaceae bacterium]|nr:YdcF family protein [Caldilineaceae bacterium]